MDTLFFLNPTPQTLIRCTEAVRHRVYARIAELGSGNSKKVIAGPGKDIKIATVRTERDLFSIAYVRAQARLLILKVGSSKVVANEIGELTAIVDALQYMDLSNVGLKFDELMPRSDQGMKILDNAIMLYCSMPSVVQRSIVPHPRHADNDAEQADHIARSLTHRVARTWLASVARDNFKDVLDGAERDPQAIRRGDRRFLVIEESTIPSIVGRKNATEMYKHFFEETEPLEPFERIRGQAPGRLPDLS
jgi:hypothetical protein